MFYIIWEGAIGDTHNMILGHEACEEGSLIKNFKNEDKVLIPAITSDWNSLDTQGGYSMHSNGMLTG